MGRTLVLPPDQRMYLLSRSDQKQRNKFSFHHFFHMESIANEHPGLDIITMQEFLETVAMKGLLIDETTHQPTFPPNNRTKWDGGSGDEIQQLNDWLRTTAQVMTKWDPEKCLAVFPKSTDPQDILDLLQIKQDVEKAGGFPTFEAYVGKPHPVNATPKERMMENWAQREELCVYDEDLQSKFLVHFPMEHGGEYQSRMLVHFYAFLFFQVCVSQRAFVCLDVFSPSFYSVSTHLCLSK